MPCVFRMVLTCWVGAALLAAGLGAQGCTATSKKERVVPGNRSGDTGLEWLDTRWFEDADELQLWNEGMEAFESGQYERARLLLEALSKKAKDENLRVDALYALACTRLILAKDRDEFLAALNLWDLWSQLAGAGASCEDPRMLTPFLYGIGTLGPRESTSGDTPLEDKPGKQDRKEIVRVVKDRECERLLKSKDKETESLRRQIVVLKKQLEALEEIHRQIQEKKEQVSPP